MHELPETSHSLIARVKDPADGQAWTEFLAIYRPVVYQLARRRGLQDADAEDLVQQVFLSVSQAIETWEPGVGQPPFRAWLSTIARNAILNALARRKPDAAVGRSSVWDLLQEQPGNDPVSASELQRESRLQIFRWAAEQIRPEFSETTWQMFWQTAVEGRPIPEVARQIGRTTGAIYMARFDVIRRLKAKVIEVSVFSDG